MPKDITPLASRGCVCQGEKKAILFKTSGICAYHTTDTEPSNEIIFWGEDADLSDYYVLEYEVSQWSGEIYREWSMTDMNGEKVECYLNRVLGEYSSYIPYDKLKKTLTEFVKEK